MIFSILVAELAYNVHTSGRVLLFSLASFVRTAYIRFLFNVFIMYKKYGIKIYLFVRFKPS